ncbi:hypothetical protein ABT246_35075 [Streptomyces sp. NPDC001553]|uniref:hypothetical protein n=1 Tax=Streptomyces sp. NPDC001553 TaxID=3154385 RepID=UPI003326B052
MEHHEARLGDIQALGPRRGLTAPCQDRGPLPDLGQGLPLGDAFLVEPEEDPLAEQLDGRIDGLAFPVAAEVGAHQVGIGVVTPETAKCPDLADATHLTHRDEAAGEGRRSIRCLGHPPPVDDEVTAAVVPAAVEFREEGRPFPVLDCLFRFPSGGWAENLGLAGVEGFREGCGEGLSGLW